MTSAFHCTVISDNYYMMAGLEALAPSVGRANTLFISTASDLTNINPGRVHDLIICVNSPDILMGILQTWRGRFCNITLRGYVNYEYLRPGYNKQYYKKRINHPWIKSVCQYNHSQPNPKRIPNSAEIAFAEKLISGITIDQVAKQLDICTKTVYARKYALLNQLGLTQKHSHGMIMLQKLVTLARTIEVKDVPSQRSAYRQCDCHHVTH